MQSRAAAVAALSVRKLPLPDMIINAYPYCSTGQQWDDITYRLFGKKVPMYTISIPMLWGGRDAFGKFGPSFFWRDA